MHPHTNILTKQNSIHTQRDNRDLRRRRKTATRNRKKGGKLAVLEKENQMIFNACTKWRVSWAVNQTLTWDWWPVTCGSPCHGLSSLTNQVEYQVMNSPVESRPWVTFVPYSERLVSTQPVLLYYSLRVLSLLPHTVGYKCQHGVITISRITPWIVVYPPQGFTEDILQNAFFVDLFCKSQTGVPRQTA